MTETRRRIDSVRRTASSVGSRAVEVLSTLAIVVGLVVWSMFWANLARLHYVQGDLLSTLFTATAFVGPAICALVWYVAAALNVDVDVPAPSIDTSVTSS